MPLHDSGPTEGEKRREAHHSICQHRDDRQYIEAGNHRRLGEVACFTFEPHISQHGGRWGFKHENIYYFDNSGAVMEL
ncbi:hypothetical protein P3T42_007313 [Paraburkholderia sp. GAS38]